MDQLRLFIALKLGNALCLELGHAQSRLQAACERAAISRGSIRWVAPQNIHLTLAFLGNVERSRSSEIEAAITRAAASVSQSVLTARGLGCFPNRHRPNNIWVGLEGELETTALLTRNLENELAGLGFPRDQRGFQPHLTLGRVKRDTHNSERARIGVLVATFPPSTFGVLDADAVHLIVSDLHAAGPEYTTLASIPLQA